jgi:hypothetical protein
VASVPTNGDKSDTHDNIVSDGPALRTVAFLLAPEKSAFILQSSKSKQEKVEGR